MINEIAIKYLYKNTHRPIDGFPKSVLQTVETCCKHSFDISFNPDYMVVGSLDDGNPCKMLKMQNINGFVVVDKEVAVVMCDRIIFFDNRNRTVRINIRSDIPSYWKLVKDWIIQHLLFEK